MNCIDYFSASKEIKLKQINLPNNNIERDGFRSENSRLKIKTENIFDNDIMDLNETFYGKVKIEKDDEIDKWEDNVLNNPEFISLDLKKENNYKSEQDKVSNIQIKEDNFNVKSENLAADTVILNTEIKIEDDQLNNLYDVSDSLNSLNNEQFNSPQSEEYENCNMYDDVFSDLHIIKRHKVARRARMSFMCNVCLKVFSSKRDLTKHERIDKCYTTCDICSETFRTRFLLRAHKRQIHFRKVHKCDACTMQFMQPIALKAHQRIHTGDRPFKCYACTKKFIRYADLAYHITITHSKKLKESYKCVICAQTFTHLTHLQQHEIIHLKFPCQLDTRFQCKECLKTFTNSQSLMNHENKGPQCSPRPYKCDVCTKTFIKPKTLHAHRKIHIDKRLYKCSLCPRKCSSLRTLTIHERKIHKRVVS